MTCLRRQLSNELVEEIEYTDLKSSRDSTMSSQSVFNVRVLHLEIADDMTPEIAGSQHNVSDVAFWLNCCGVNQDA